MCHAMLGSADSFFKKLSAANKDTKRKMKEENSFPKLI